MKVAIFVTIWSSGISSADLKDHFLENPLTFLKDISDVIAVEFYVPETGDVPKMDDIPAPTIIVQIDMDSVDAAQSLVDSNEFEKLFIDKDGFSSPAEKINLELFEPVHYLLPGQDTPSARTAPLSFVVRYFGPVQDQFKFVDFYTKNHPALLAKFPNIRNVLCYLPLGWETQGEIRDDSIIIGNEVVFDDVESFNAALASDVMEEVMADAELFTSFGYSSHHAMLREMVYERGL
jgi:uncharacterized protein (TIGR02118 family)